MKQTQWTVTDLTNAKPFAPWIHIVEFQDSKGEWHDFEILKTANRLVFGGSCNVGFLESGYIERQGEENIEDTMLALISDLQTYYNDGPQYVSRIVCNQRM